MEAQPTKSTLQQLRMRYPFDIPTLARQAGVGTATVYYALVQKPIYRQSAEKILIALSQHTGRPLSFEQVDIITWDDYLFLWIVRASRETNQNDTEAHLLDEYQFVYARDRHHAALLAGPWLSQKSHLTHHSFTPCPEGFLIGDIAIPGHLTKGAL
ncbi:hypothetical protein KDA_30390 [Dictyobacter alpinus]|uniref:Uncharacterized protein n=1 Tax=Dictyobacter alpinus TaxID=2014873 RepID=A0A402B877_9CHLR|nr:hypothetical protein [Dictyobacter alpinus]GCE27555.1 hypothetical protein KDA_30390 [Dictyobacter alpinus]